MIDPHPQATAASTASTAADRPVDDLDAADGLAHAPPPDDVGPALPSTATTSLIMSAGTLAWIGWVWLATFVVVTGIEVAIGVSGDLDTSVWQGAAAGWQRWPVLAAGVSAIATFAPMLVTNGVTRRQLARSAAATAGVVALLGAAFIVAGFLVEHLVFALADQAHHLGEGRDEVGRAVGAATLGRLFVEHALALAAAYVTGWQVAIGFYTRGVTWGALLILPSVVPLLVVEGVPGGVAGFGIDVLDDWLRDVGTDSFLVGVLLSLAVTGASAAIAAHRTRAVALRP
jgi:hypothetical protein